ncbi:MAG: hypothetical protein M0Q92_02765 [Methanoregula sp.]|jgi:hypothetical protein|nr:hypothetical protein [Methanoregula sp.]
MANCNVRTFEGATAAADAETFIETLEETKLLALTSWTAANVPAIMVVYKT